MPILSVLKTLIPSPAYEVFKGRFARGVGLIAGGTALGQAVVLIASPVITRLYCPEDFGIFSVYASLLGLLTTFGSMRYAFAIPLPKDADTAANLLALSLLVIFFMTFIISLFIWKAGDHIVLLLKIPKLRPYLWLLPVGVFGASTYSAFNFWAIRENNYKKIGWTKLIQGFMLTISQIAIGSFKASPLGLILGQILGHTSGTGNLALSAWRQNKTILKGVNLNKIVKAARRYRRFPLIASGSSFLDSLGLEAPLIFFAVFWGTSVVGWFGLCQRVIWAPLSVLGTSVSQVFFGEASKLLLKEPNLLKNLYIRTAKKLFFIGLIPASALAMFSPWLFRILFGPEWSQSGRYAQILAPMVLVRFVVNPLSQTLNVLERQELQLLWVIIRLALVMTSLGMAIALNFSDLIAVALFSGAMTLAYLLYFGLCWYVLCKK